MMSDEIADRIKRIWELHLEMELGQLQVAADLLRRYEGVEAAEILPPALPEVPVHFETNKDYVRSVLVSQIDLRTDGMEYVDVSDLPKGHRYFEYQKIVNEGGAPSEEVIEMAVARDGIDIRDETEGEHPVVDLRQPVPATK